MLWKGCFRANSVIPWILNARKMSILPALLLKSLRLRTPELPHINPSQRHNPKCAILPYALLLALRLSYSLAFLESWKDN
jgi:hypothetical protein